MATSASAPPLATGPADSPERLPRSSNTRWAIIFTVVAVAVFVFYQFLYKDLDPSVQRVFRQWLPITAVNEALIFVIMALGLNIVVGYAGLLDLGYVAFWAIGGYTGGWLMSGFFHNVNIRFGGTSPAGADGIHINFWLVLVVAGLFCALWGVIIGAPTLRLKSDYLAIVTLGFGEIIPQVFINGDSVFGYNISNGTQGILPVDAIGTGPLQALPGVDPRLGTFAGPLRFVVFCALAALCVFVSLRIRTGRLGRAWLAIREDELAASMMGVPLMRTKLAAYAVGAFFGGLGGVAFATHINGVLADRFNFAISVIILAMVVLGGMGNVWGVILGALGLAWINAIGLERVGDTFNGAFGTKFDFRSQSFLIFGAILVLMMLFRREGLIPEARTRQVLREPERGQLESVGADMEGDMLDVEAPKGMSLRMPKRRKKS
ncbi:MAG: branched-chain amino acid ABC transporter permease [Actinobacteria bacterium]|nr:branched-chain amino acid ABC transporter permease [Actinomycetota bacterium]